MHHLLRYLRNKPKVDNKSSMFVFEYSDELNDTSIFVRLNEICAQAALEPANSQAEIMAEFGQVSDISEALNTLKIVINYALTTAAEPDLELLRFLSRIYTQPGMLEHAKSILKSKVCITQKLTHAN